jgi:hypothetical protein
MIIIPNKRPIVLKSMDSMIKPSESSALIMPKIIAEATAMTPPRIARTLL